MIVPERVSFPFDLHEFCEVIDVRAPAEFEEDHLPGAVNLPVLDDAQRHEVGLLHASNPFQARRTGASLISRNIHHHLEAYLSEKPKDYAPLVYCWRGNMRSGSMATILKAVGWRARVLEGGYKAWRKWLMADLQDRLSAPFPSLIVLGGSTGCGKTRILQLLRQQGHQVLDLEELANHKGSILGSPQKGLQPSQKLFESRLWQMFARFDLSRPVFTEAESNRIGTVQLPGPLWHQLGKARVLEITMSLSDRAHFLSQDYRHFVDDPEELKATLDGLRRLRGHEQIDQWHAQINAEQWPEFLESILVHHYDLAYRPLGSADSNYHRPEATINVSGPHHEDFEEASAQVLTALSAPMP